MASWRTDGHLRHHFARHRHEIGVRTLEEFDASAQETLAVGIYFEFFHEDANEWRTGCYDLGSSRLTVLDSNDCIVTHFRCAERYIMELPDSTWE